MSAPRTLNELFFRAVDAFGNRPAAMRSRLSGAWTDLSYADLLDQVQAVSNGMRELGVPAGGHVAILSENRPEWAIADFACLTCCCADVPVYPTLPAGQIAYILKNSEATAIFVSNQEQLAKIREVRGQLPGLKHIITMDRGLESDDLIAFTELVRRGRAARSSYPRWKEEALEATPDDLATLIYTSGTTGDPKGVMLTHGNITFNVIKGLEVLPLQPTDECLSFLPLSHIFERMAGHYVMFHAGAVINYALSIDTVSE
ncbi:MAG: AMP-binding protein, partial [Gemmatimonadales bacterium]